MAVGKEMGQVDHKACDQVDAAFLVRVQFRRNATWQGTMEWLEGRQKVSFRSALEMLQLMEKVVGDSPNTLLSWEEEQK